MAEGETVPAVLSSSVSVAFSDASPYCFAVSSILDLPVQTNFLATQVWPAARVAATTLEDCLVRRNPPPWLCRTTNTTSTSTLTPTTTTTATHRNTTPFTICELGCGPGLPSLTAAAVVAAATEASDLTTNIRVIATDVDDFALELVQAAAKEQGLDRIVTTHRFDLVHHNDRRENADTKNNTNTPSAAAAVGWLDTVDLFVMSDVFESTTVAKGAAQFTHQILTDGKQRRIWVFAQTDRVQREVYVQELQMLFAAAATTATATIATTATATTTATLQWLPVESYDIENDRLWLCDVDETLVNYG